MERNDLERAVGQGARLTCAAAGLGVSLVLAPARFVLRAVFPSPDGERWAPAGADERERAPSPVAPERPARDDDLSAAAAARRRTRDRESETGDSPGPEIHVDEPWAGYDAMNVAEVAGRLRGADPALQAMVRLYEERHKNRRGVLARTEFG